MHLDKNYYIKVFQIYFSFHVNSTFPLALAPYQGNQEPQAIEYIL